MAVTDQDRLALLALVTKLVANATGMQPILAADYLLEPAAAVVAVRATWQLPAEEVELTLSQAEFRPPFEWLAEITIRQAGVTALGHYLITDTQVVAAQKRDLTPLDSEQLASLRERLEQLA